MFAFEDHTRVPAASTGVVRLLPVPNLVMFPHVVQPLRVAERRYCDLLEDALRDDQLMAVAVLSPGWEADYDGRPRLGPFACLSKVAVSGRLEDGTHNLLLVGLGRVRLINELSRGKSYREAVAVICEDLYPPNDADGTGTLKRTLCRQLQPLLPQLPHACEQTEQLFGGSMPLGALTDLLGHALSIEVAAKEELLCQVDVERRADLLLGHLAVGASLDGAASSLVCFPPAFSVN
jgi:uncharacterized protein